MKKLFDYCVGVCGKGKKGVVLMGGELVECDGVEGVRGGRGEVVDEDSG